MTEPTHGPVDPLAAPITRIDLGNIANRGTFVELPNLRRQPTRVSGRLQATTPISSMGISALAAQQLTPAAAKLTKQQLVDLGGPNAAATAVRLNLTVADVTSIRTAFAAPIFLGGVGLQAGDSAFSVSCCCCTPCCCAAAALAPTGGVV